MIMFNYPRKIHSLDKLRSKVSRIKKPENQKLFLRWLEQELILYKIHEGQTRSMILAELISSFRNNIYKKRPRHEYHEKSKAWRIERNFAHGGTPWRSEHFETEQECLDFIEEKDLISDF